MFEQDFQITPELTDEEYDRLKKDIEENGCKVPVDVDEDGNILDGYYRAMICDELGIEYETHLCPDMTEAEKIEHVIRMNVLRRQLSEEQIQELISKIEEEHPDANIQKIAEMVGIDEDKADSSASATIKEDDDVDDEKDGNDDGEWMNEEERRDVELIDKILGRDINNPGEKS